MSPRVVIVLAVLVVAFADDGQNDIIYQLTDEEYYEMPHLFHLDEYDGCLATGDVYCLGSFELTADKDNKLFHTMQRYSANWVDNFNHTRLHRGLCLKRSCAEHSPPPLSRPSTHEELQAWFSSCVNATMQRGYNLRAHLYQLDYCKTSAARSGGPLSASEKGFAAALAAVLALAVVSTTLDFALSDDAKKSAGWALSWSLRQSWRTLTAPPPTPADCDLRIFDGLRVFCMFCVIIEHVCWLSTLSYLADTRFTEQTRRATDVMLMTNSTLVVQIFFIMSSFLLAHKLLQDRSHLPPIRTFIQTMFNRIIRLSPSYFAVVWFAASWWQRLGHGPQWDPLVGAEAQICRNKWWTHLLYLNNVIYPDDKCLIQTWYLAADTQLYALALAMTLLLRNRRGTTVVLATLLLIATGVTFALAYIWHLVPTFIVHRPELVRAIYHGDASFNVLYQSPLGNAAGALCGLLLAHAHHALRRAGLQPQNCQVFRWVSVCAAPVALWWAALSPLLVPAGPPPRAAAAALAALERPVFALLVIVALLGAINGVKSPWRTWLSGRGWAFCARLSFGALLLHMPLNKALLASRLTPIQLDRQNAIFEWFGVAAISYAAAFPLALLVEIPVQRLHRELTKSQHKAKQERPPQHVQLSQKPEKTDIQ
ncbi:nose resistant to fluoxetine protein 6 [Papilio machaon]|uniref:nose resistant to fluoxetine protein 6 n=1 Tax=Papilio machaon TaxID=76193 RepID=UPI001E6636C6|nr:nose resistant to fluoxetine protein 6 [Papilio machaon]